MSFVEVSPSTEIALKLPSTASFSAAARRAGEAGASVVTNASIVAMFGWIIPAPFATPTTRHVRPAWRKVACATFGAASVVRIARETASRPPAESRAKASGRNARTFSSGRTTPMTPGRGDEDLLARAARELGRALLHAPRRRRARRAGDGVRAPGVDDDRRHPPAAPLQRRARESDRRRLEAVLREDGRGVRALGRDEERHVETRLLAQAGPHGRAEETLRQPHLARLAAAIRVAARRAACATRFGDVPPDRGASRERLPEVERREVGLRDPAAGGSRREPDPRRLGEGEAAPDDLVRLPERHAPPRERVGELRREEPVVAGRRPHPSPVAASGPRRAR